MPSEASWHPAFMPNSAADIISKKAPPSEPTSAPGHRLEVETAKSIPPPLASSLDTHGVPDEDVQEIETLEDNGNTRHPELANLRSALTTSLASPGGVEFDDVPFPNRLPEDPITQDKADFPSTDPTAANKHVSTMSFARTVSQEVSLGEDDEVDHDWNIHETDTDPFKLMPKSDRTNSFPQVPPAHSPAVHLEARSNQAEDIINEVEQEPGDLFSDDEHGGEADFFTQAAAQKASQEKNNSFSADYQPYGGVVQLEEDQVSQARYEEGLPLVESTENPQQSPPAQSAVETDGGDAPHYFGQTNKSEHTPPVQAAFEEDEDAVDFFAEISKSEHSPEPRPLLERKSTSQVMNSFNFQPHEQTHPAVSEDVELEATSGSQRPETARTDTTNSPEPPITEQHEVLAGSVTKPGEGDLAEKWQAALDDDEFLDDDDLLPDDEPTEGKHLDPADVFGSDDEGFLEDIDEQNQVTEAPSQLTTAPDNQLNGHVAGFGNAPSAVPSAGRPGSGSSRYLPTDLPAATVQTNKSYAPSAPQFTDLSQPTAASFAPSPYAAPVTAFTGQQTQLQRPELPKAESFVNKNKGGYTSPYDLPMEVVKPRKRASLQQMNRGYNQSSAPSVTSPPRSESTFTQPPPPSRGSTSSLSPPTTGYSGQQGTLQQATTPSSQVPPSLKSKSSTSSFFEELPMSSKPKAATRQAPPSQPPVSHGPAGVPPPPPTATSYATPPQQGPQTAVYSPQGLVAPERVSPYASIPSHPATVPVAASRYSPAPGQPPTQAAPPSAQSRYSPALQMARQGGPSYSAVPSTASQAPLLPHLPRTSSPLAHFERSPDSGTSSTYSQAPSFDRRSSSSYESSLKPHHLPPTREVDEVEDAPEAQAPSPPQNYTTKAGQSQQRRAASSYLPQQARRTTPPHAVVPPKRSQTQSPGSAYTGGNLQTSPLNPYQRPASTEVSYPPRSSTGQPPVQSKPAGRPRGFSTGYNYITPTDGREHDPLQRWRGAPVFCWGVGGALVTSFPKDVPRYVNQTPMTIRTPGQVKIQNIKDLDPLPERLSRFPGPLKGKSKKKDVIAWLNSGIQILEQNASNLMSASTLTHEDKRTEERILLWKILRVFIEHDGTLEGNATVDAAVRAVLSPGLEDGLGNGPSYTTGADLSGIIGSTGRTVADPVDPAAVDQLRNFLLKGDREKAVWEAVDKRLWGHAMLISNTVSKELFKQVAQEFVQKEVRSVGENTESLAALYEVFAGNFDESIDELVPPSARAGFQMVSTSDATGPSKDALRGLDRWRETLGLVLSNRSFDDNKALNALGKLLCGYGRAEAGHICFLFARTTSMFGGIDDPASNVVLVGSDHIRQPYEFDREMEPILLTEVFEYGLSLFNTSNIATFTPHLSVYKLQHAKILAEYGYREKALQYCESIVSSITSQTRRSPYHHKLLIGELDDLSQRLKQSPKDEKSSWVSKPSIDKVSSSVWSTFNKFVAGDEVDTGTPGSSLGGSGEHGPFARLAGGTPTISRAPSAVDLYGSYSGGVPINGGVTTKAGSRYAPGAAYTPPNHEPQSAASYQSGQLYGSQPRSSFEEAPSGQHQATYPEPGRPDPDFGRRSPPLYAPQKGPSYAPSPYTPASVDSPYGQTRSQYTPLKSALTAGLAAAHPAAGQASQASASYEPPTSSYVPPTSSSYEPPSSSYDPPSANNRPQPGIYDPSPSSYEPRPSSYEPPSNGYEPPTNGYEPPTNGYEPPSNSYEPPTSTFEPPYEPATMDDEPESPESLPKKKSFLDDDDDVPAAQPAPPAPREKTKAEKDRETDEAFRKAAEADGTSFLSLSR